jgi:hypothetical protein
MGKGICEDMSKSSPFTDNHDFLLKNVSADLTIDSQIKAVLDHSDRLGYSLSTNIFSGDLKHDVVQFAASTSVNLGSEAFLQAIAPNLHAQVFTNGSTMASTRLSSSVNETRSKQTYNPVDSNLAKSLVHQTYPFVDMENDMDIDEEGDEDIVVQDMAQEWLKDDGDLLVAESNIFQSILGFNVGTSSVTKTLLGNSVDPRTQRARLKKMLTLLREHVHATEKEFSKTTPKCVPTNSSISLSHIDIGTERQSLENSQLLDITNVHVVDTERNPDTPTLWTKDVTLHEHRIRRALTKEKMKSLFMDNTGYRTLTMAACITEMEHRRHRDLMLVERANRQIVTAPTLPSLPTVTKAGLDMYDNANLVREICEINMDNLFASMSLRTTCGELEYRSLIDIMKGSHREYVLQDHFVTRARDTTVKEWNDESSPMGDPNREKRNIFVSNIRNVHMTIFPSMNDQSTYIHYLFNLGSVPSKDKSKKYAAEIKNVFDVENLQWGCAYLANDFYRKKTAVDRKGDEHGDEYADAKLSQDLFNSGGAFRRVLMSAFVRFLIRLLERSNCTTRKNAMGKGGFEATFKGGLYTKPPTHHYADTLDVVYKLFTRPITFAQNFSEWKAKLSRPSESTFHSKLLAYQNWEKGSDASLVVSRNNTHDELAPHPLILRHPSQGKHVPKAYNVLSNLIVHVKSRLEKILDAERAGVLNLPRFTPGVSTIPEAPEPPPQVPTARPLAVPSDQDSDNDEERGSDTDMDENEHLEGGEDTESDSNDDPSEEEQDEHADGPPGSPTFQSSSSSVFTKRPNNVAQRIALKSHVSHAVNKLYSTKSNNI